MGSPQTRFVSSAHPVNVPVCLCPGRAEDKRSCCGLQGTKGGRFQSVISGVASLSLAVSHRREHFQVIRFPKQEFDGGNNSSAWAENAHVLWVLSQKAVEWGISSAVCINKDDTVAYDFRPPKCESLSPKGVQKGVPSTQKLLASI